MRLITAYRTAASTLAICTAVAAAPAFAQSTGSIDFDKEIVVTGSRSSTQNVAGIQAPDTPKAKAVITQEAIARANPGQTILDTINQVPGVSFQNNDAYGSSGGTLSIRGFDSSRISLTFDGVPLNDSGNYAIYSNQQLDPELIEQVNVNLGTTDIDSPTASAVGGTVNYRSLTPSHDFGAMLSGSAGQFDFQRIFAKIETGDLTAGGIRAWVAASRATNDNPFNNYGKVNKQQYNAKLYVPMKGSDFIAISGNWNVNRNNFFGSLPLRYERNRVVGSGSANRYPLDSSERKYTINYPCTTADARPGVADFTNSCGTEFDRRYNPSNTGNIRINSKFTLADNLVLTVDPSYQVVKANGGGTVTGREQRSTINGVAYTGFIGGSYYFGKDLNGDGDTLDQVTLVAPSQTATRRIGVISSLRWDFSPNQTFRLAYTFDRARHRQTGEVAPVLKTGEPSNVFAIDNALTTADGFLMEKRDRLSYATLNKFAAEYRGNFMDDNLVVVAGVAAPFFKRDLTNYCFTTSAGGFLDCFGQNGAFDTSYAAAKPYSYDPARNPQVLGVSPPQHRVLNYSKILPSLGFTYKFAPALSLFGNYSKGLSVPGTDNLYNAFYYPDGSAQAKPDPETTDNFDMGLRYRSGIVQGQVSGFYNQFHNRLASAYDPELDQTVYRNLGDVKKYGVDGYLSIQPVPAISLYAFASYLKSEIKDDIVIARNLDGTPVYAATAGKSESGIPNYSFGGTVRGAFGPLEVGITAKKTGERFVFDNNEASYTGGFNPIGAKACTGTATAPVCTAAVPVARNQIYYPEASGYWLVNLDARVKLGFIGMNDQSYFQLNVYNLFDAFYVGGFGGGLTQSVNYNRTTGQATYGSPGFVQIGAPRTISGTVVFKF